MDGSIEPVQVFVRIRPEFYLDNNENRSNDNDNTSTILNTSIITQYEHWNKETEVKLSNILKRFKQENNVG